MFWHAAANPWVYALYENGTTFYTSRDLKTRTKTSNINWGSECPDIYELPLVGNTGNSKWALQDASGSYYLGRFNGATFIPDAGGPYKMDVGPHLYASQTFYKGTFPDSRVVQMAWMDHRSSPVQTTPWSGSISYPAELKLKTSPEGVRSKRTLIAGINSIYGATQHWGAQTLASGQNLLAGLDGKTYDLEVVVDAARTSATRLTFQPAHRSFGL